MTLETTPSKFRYLLMEMPGACSAMHKFRVDSCKCVAITMIIAVVAGVMLGVQISFQLLPTAIVDSDVAASVEFLPENRSITETMVPAPDKNPITPAPAETQLKFESNLTAEGDPLDEEVEKLFLAWEPANPSTNAQQDETTEKRSIAGADAISRPPHLEDCEEIRARQDAEHWDSRLSDGSLPPWAVVKKLKRKLGEKYTGYGSHLFKEEERINPKDGALLDVHTTGPRPPWVVGDDSDNYPLTRRAQRDIWLHQHPRNCSDPSVKFFYFPLTTKGKHGVGAEMATLAGALGLAMTTGRILIIGGYDRADHDGCTGESKGQWTCYFALETSEECKRRAKALLSNARNFKGGKDALMRNRNSYAVMSFWYPPVPQIWGRPWLDMPPMVEAQNKIVHINRLKNLFRWWRGQSWRYLMRQQSLYTCQIVNQERHKAFGRLAAMHTLKAELAIKQRAAIWQDANPGSLGPNVTEGAMEEMVWRRKPALLVPRPLISMHVRMGDKGKEMRLAGFDEYMALLERIRRHDPAAVNVWLSSEMQKVIDEANSIPGWNWMYSSVRRQVVNESMPAYEHSLGPAAAMANSYANLYIALEADYFVGALGSAWSFMIDAMRCTGGKMMNGFMSVNRDPRWL